MSRTKTEKKLKRKRNPFLVRSIILAKKLKQWDVVAQMLSAPRKKRIEKNLDEINRVTKEGDTLVVPGKVLGKGSVDKKIRVCAFSFSQEALRKLKERKCEVVNIEEEIKINPRYQGVKILR